MDMWRYGDRWRATISVADRWPNHTRAQALSTARPGQVNVAAPHKDSRRTMPICMPSRITGRTASSR
eukprot:9634253-Lingulodinium_polyedra.AAC.1